MQDSATGVVRDPAAQDSFELLVCIYQRVMVPLVFPFLGKQQIRKKERKEGREGGRKEERKKALK
jgi:hypothetical protein